MCVLHIFTLSLRTYIRYITLSWRIDQHFSFTYSTSAVPIPVSICATLPNLYSTLHCVCVCVCVCF
jgi:hypothetical protein